MRLWTKGKCPECDRAWCSYFNDWEPYHLPCVKTGLCDFCTGDDGWTERDSKIVQPALRYMARLSRELNERLLGKDYETRNN